MGKPTGFIEIQRKKHPTRPVAQRLEDWNEVYLPYREEELQKQGARCMDCGIPFCHQGCPLGNLIPDWNDLVYRNRWESAIERLHATTISPNYRRLCPAPCEGAACSASMTIRSRSSPSKSPSREGVRRRMGTAKPPLVRTDKTVAVIGSGPLARRAEQLNRAGHFVTVFEKSDRIGGLLRYGIPEFKMEKKVLNRRLDLMEQEGVSFRTSVNVGVDVTVDQLKTEFDAIVLAGGAGLPRDLPVPGRELKGIHFAMEYLTLSNKRVEGDSIPEADFISAKGKRVVIIGGGDTAPTASAPCIGRAHCQCISSSCPEPPDTRTADNPCRSGQRVPRLDGARRGWGARVLRFDPALQRR